MNATMITSTDWARVFDKTMMLMIMLNVGDVFEDQKRREKVCGILGR